MGMPGRLEVGSFVEYGVLALGLGHVQICTRSSVYSIPQHDRTGTRVDVDMYLGKLQERFTYGCRVNLEESSPPHWIKD
jgi:hypothetical protein